MVKGINGAKDFAAGIIRFPQLHSSTKDLIAIDNVKIYYSDVNYECAHNYVNDTCTWCGKVEHVTHCDICDGEVLSAGAAVVGKSVSLGELIDMNVYMALNARLAGTEDAKVVLTAGDRTAEYALKDAVKTADGKYKFSIALRSIDMAKDVVVSIVGEEATTYTTSIKAYAEGLIDITDNAKEAALAKALLNYGAYAQTYFAEKNGDENLLKLLANDGLSASDKALAAIPEGALDAYAFVTEGATEDVALTSMALILSSKTYVKVYFTASEAATVTVNGQKLTKTAEGDEYYVIFTVANPADADRAANIVVTDGNTVASASISALTAVANGVGNTTAKLSNLLAAYYAFYECAEAYVAK